MALSGNRFMVQTRFDKENTPCDDYIITATCLFACAVDIARCFCDVPQELENLADCLVMTVQGCMHAQQHIEIQKIKATGYMGPPQHIMGMMSGPQQQVMMQGKPGGGGPVPQQYGNQMPPQMQQMQMQQQYPQQQMQMQQGGAFHVQCGGCGQVFGAQQRGMTIACPFCGTHNAV